MRDRLRVHHAAIVAALNRAQHERARKVYRGELLVHRRRDVQDRSLEPERVALKDVEQLTQPLQDRQRAPDLLPDADKDDVRNDGATRAAQLDGWRGC